ERTRDCVLQQHFVGFEALPVHVLDLRRIKVHGEDADRQEHAKDDVQQRNARGNGKLQLQKAILSAQARGRARPSCIHSKWVGGDGLRCLKYSSPLPKYRTAGHCGQFSVPSSQFSVRSSGTRLLRTKNWELRLALVYN